MNGRDKLYNEGGTHIYAMAVQIQAESLLRHYVHLEKKKKGQTQISSINRIEQTHPVLARKELQEASK